MSYLLGIDLGSTSLKAVAFDLKGNLKAIASRPTEKFQQDEAHPNWVVWMPENIWSGVADAVRDVVKQLDGPGSIAGVAVTGMGMDGLPIDAEGNWLYPFISWHDGRTQPQHEWWQEKVGIQKIYRICGHTPMHINSINRIMWVREHEPEIYAKMHKWLLIEDFINYMLCGVKVTDYSMAATTQVFDCNKLAWSDELIELAGIDKAILPEVKPSGTIIGEVSAEAARRTGLRPGTPVVLGGHDYLCGALASGAGEPDTLINITGTWEITMATLGRPNLRSNILKCGVIWDPHVIRDPYCLFIDAVAADMTEWYRTQFGQVEERMAIQEGCSVWPILMKEAEEAPVGSGGLTFLPHMSGCSCPVRDPKSLGAFVGLSNFSTRSTFIRAIIEGLNYQSRQMVEAIEKVTGPLTRFRAIGGTVRNEFWMQNKADVLGRPIEVPNQEEATCLGVAMLAGIGVGLYKDEAQAFKKVFRRGTVFRPRAAVSRKYERIYNDIYLPLYPALKSVSHAISESSLVGSD